MTLLVAVSLTGAPDARGTTSDGARVAVMTLGDFDSHPEWSGAVSARVQRLNEHGGVVDADGARHTVLVITCNTKLDPKLAETCARRAVERGVVAVVGMGTVDSDRVWPILESAGIPVIGTRITTDQDVTSGVSFPIASGIVGTFSAMPQLLARKGAQKIGILISDFGSATTSLVSLIENGVGVTASSIGPVQRVPIGVDDLRPYVAAVATVDVDGLVTFLANGTETELIEALDAADFRGMVVTQASLLDGSLSGADRAKLDGTLLVGEFPPFSARVNGLRRFRNDMLDYDATLPFNEGALNFWLSAWVFERVAAGLPRIDASSTLHAMATLEGLDMGGVTPPLTTPTANTVYPRLFNPTVTFAQVHRSGVRRIGKRFFDPLSAQLR